MKKRLLTLIVLFVAIATGAWAETISYELRDSYGDGWNGASITVVESLSSTTITTLTLTSGSSTEGTIELEDNVPYEFVFNPGNYPDECSCTFYDGEGEVIYSSENMGGGGVLFEYTPGQSKNLKEGQLVAIDVPHNNGTTKLLVRCEGFVQGINATTGQGEIFGEVSVIGKTPERTLVTKPRKAVADNPGVYVDEEDIPDYGYWLAVDRNLEGELTIPGSFEYNGTTYKVRLIREGAFMFSKLSKINLPDELYSVSASFYFSSIKSLKFPKYVEEIEAVPFIGCEDLESITVDENNEYLLSPAGSNVIIENNRALKAKGPKKDLEPYNDEEEENILILGIKTSVIPDNVTAIGDYAFVGTVGLKSITIPASVKTIEAEAFMACPNLRQIIMKSATPPDVGEYTFDATMEGLTLQDYREFCEYTIQYGNVEVEPQVTAKDFTLTNMLKAMAKAKKAAAANETGIPDNYAEAGDPQVYQHAALCVPTGAKEAYIEYVATPRAKSFGPVTGTPAGNENYWAWFTHIVEPVVIPASGVAVISYDENYKLPDGVSAYIVVKSEKGDGTNSYVSVKEITDAIPGGEAVIIKGTAGTEVYVMPADEDDPVADTTGNLLVAVDEDSTIGSTEGTNSNFVLDENGNFVPANGSEVDEGGAFLQIPTEDALAGGGSFVIDFDGTIETSINQPTTYDLQSTTTYNLQGQRVGNDLNVLSSGVYVVRQGKTTRKTVIQ
ncbi:MAG: leucine-rich repeat domain-containing protein [Prevotella sp.]|nr:leucine-rich repeat domain-containing protein [Prevotella sp.]